MKIRRIFNLFWDLLFTGLFVYLLIFPKMASEPTKEALEFCGKTLVPSLFVYLVLSKIVITTPLADRLIRILGLEGFLLLGGTLCGCPLGAKNAVTLFEQGKIDRKHGEFLCSFTNNAGMSFVLGFVGKELFGDVRVGVKLLIFQIVSSFFTALIMKRVIFGKEKLPKPRIGKPQKADLREAFSDSAVTMLNICAGAVFFIVTGNAISNILNLNPILDGILKCLLEFSSGCLAAMKTGRFAFPLVAFAIGQTGFCVGLQVKSVVGNNFSIRPYFLGKVISCSIMTVLSLLAC